MGLRKETIQVVSEFIIKDNPRVRQKRFRAESRIIAEGDDETPGTFELVSVHLGQESTVRVVSQRRRRGQTVIVDVAPPLLSSGELFKRDPREVGVWEKTGE